MDIIKFIEYLTDANFFIVSRLGSLQNDITDNQKLYYNFLRPMIRIQTLFSYFETNQHAVLYPDKLGLYWLFIPHYENDLPILLYIIGPFCTGTLDENDLKKIGVSDELYASLTTLRPTNLSLIYDLERAFTLCTEKKQLPLDNMEIIKYPLIDDSNFNSYQAKITTNRSFNYENILSNGILHGKTRDEIINDLNISGAKIDTEDMSLEQYRTYFIGLAHILSYEVVKTGIPENDIYIVTESIIQQVNSCKDKKEVDYLIWALQDALFHQILDNQSAQNLSQSIHSVQNYINNHLDEPLTIGDIAKPLGYAPYYLSSLFKRETGYSINYYIKLKRCQRASFFLTYTNHSLQTISTLVGFSNQSVFSKSFKEVCDISPKQFRQVQTKNPNII